MIQSPPTVVHTKRKATSLDDILEAKRPGGMFSLKQEFGRLLQKKKEFLARQKKRSFLIEPVAIADDHPMNEFSSFYRKVSNAPMNTEEHPAQLKLIEQVIQESIIVEWPRSVPGIADDRDIDMAPLIHRARNVVKCRTSHPTLRVKVFAISNENDASPPAPPAVEAFFKASLVKLANEGGEPRQVAGRMILTQREGTAATKIPDQSVATVTSEGKLVASQAVSETSHVMLDRMKEPTGRTTPFRFEDGVLCATFPEMGVTLNSMVDRRQLATRYAAQIEVAINIDNKLIVHQTVLSHAFLIAITNDQTEPLLHSIFWGRLTDSVEQSENVEIPLESPLQWGELQIAVKNFIKSQMVQARQLRRHEICHIQTMIFLPRVARCTSMTQIINLEEQLFGNARIRGNRELQVAMKELRDRLLEEKVLRDTLIERREFMQDKCLSILDLCTELSHSPWLWLFRVSEMIQDVGHRLCPTPLLADKKSSKTKKQMAASEEYQTMCSLFNKDILTLASLQKVRQAFLHDDAHGSMLIRFCDENCGYLSFAFGTDNVSQLTIGSASSDQIKDFKQGLVEVLMDEAYPSKFDKMVRLESGDESQLSVVVLKKYQIFHNYMSLRTKNDIVQVLDQETQRINPLTGGKIERLEPSSFFCGLGVPQLGQESSNISWPAHLLVLVQQQLMKSAEGFNVGTLHGTDGDDGSDDGSAVD